MIPSVSVGFGDYKVEAKGLMALSGAVVMLVAAGFLWTQVHVYQSLQTDIKGVQAELQILSYVLTQPEGARPQMMMPDALYKRMMPK